MEYTGSRLAMSRRLPPVAGWVENLAVCVGWRTQREGQRAISFIRGRQQGSFLSNCSEKSREMRDWQPASGKKSKSTTFSLEGVMMAVGKSLQQSRAVRTT